MTPGQELALLKSEYAILAVQLEELTLVLLEKDEEIAYLKRTGTDIKALQSKLDQRLDELHQMQDIIGTKQQQAEGAADREAELHEELAVAYSLQEKYDLLLTAYTYTQTQLQELQHTFAATKKEKDALQQMAAKAVELQSLLENAEIEIAALRDTIQLLNNRTML